MAEINNIVGEPDLGLIPANMLPGRLPPEVLAQIEYGYSIDRQGLPACLKAVADYYNETNNLSGTRAISPDQVIMADGARAAASVIVIYLINYYEQQGIDYPRTLLIRPGYNLYDEQFRGLGYKLDSVNIPFGASDEDKLSIIKRGIKPETVVLPITNPNNPTGEIYSEQFLLMLLSLLDEFPQLNIINDAVYDHIHRADVKRPISIFALANIEQRKRVYEVNSLAKSFSYPAIRAGWAVGDKDIIAAIQETKDPMLGPLNNIAQLVTISALNYTKKLEPGYHKKVNEIYDERLKLVHDKLHKIKGFHTEMPAGAFYYFADFSGVKHINVNEIVKKLADQNIKVASGTKFGAPNHIRINCAANEKQLASICDAIVEICKQ